MAYATEPSFTHGQAATARVAVLFCNLGTPERPDAAALRRYLAEFLSDPRVVEIPRPLWWLILHGIILRVRPAKSAAKYASIWTPQGSPLKVWTERQSQGLQAALQQRGHQLLVRYAMRYGQPSIASQLDALKALGVQRVLVLPAYPQYSGPTTASVVDAVGAWARRVRSLPELRFINRYHDHPGYIEALAQQVQAHWRKQGRAQVLVMSFHGVPQRSLMRGDPYHCECQKTARLLAERLGLAQADYQVTFQSRFGKAQWLQPYTEPRLKALAAQGLKHVDLICPGFTSDCLETLEEIAQEGRDAFIQAGGASLHYIPCLNDATAWIDALADLAEQHLLGWDSRSGPDLEALALSAQRAQACEHALQAGT